ncbi:hypothetical protein ATANTOWER_014389 [Ataeniobius toweri]|uniref:Uncharacterized protein n=1 Tax=Ataeniobius toweri TaxID=208326 RepID=A0ABU7CCE9_9TELE|nr:hypothetical protein [Ataeniobius toweri]
MKKIAIEQNQNRQPRSLPAATSGAPRGSLAAAVGPRGEQESSKGLQPTPQRSDEAAEGTCTCRFDLSSAASHDYLNGAAWRCCRGSFGLRWTDQSGCESQCVGGRWGDPEERGLVPNQDGKWDPPFIYLSVFMNMQL